MPPRTASSCSRALQRQLVSPLDTIWVSEALLASVFERYFAVSHVPRRRASSTPGPLESRRRLGKRRIGALNAGYAPSALPDWSLPNALDLSKWKWEPPTLLSVREENRQAQLQLAQHWLGKWLVPPSIREESKNLEPPAPLTLLESLDQFQLRISAGPFPDLIQACDDICLQLKDNTEPLADKSLFVESLDGILEALQARFGSSSHALTLFAQLYSAVVVRIFASPTETPSSMDPEVCQCLLNQLLNLPVGDELCNLFELTMRFIPAKHSDSVETHVEALLGKFLLSWGDTAACSHVSHVQIMSMSSALSRLSPSKTSVFEAAKRLLLQQSGSLEQLYHVRYAWVSVLARLPRLRTDALLEGLSTLLGDRPPAATVSSMDLCRFLLQHWSCTRKVRSSERVRELFQELSSLGEPMGIGALAHALYTLNSHWQPRITELCNVLKGRGRFNDLIRSFTELAQHQDLHPRLLWKVAVVCDDYRVALRLHEIWNQSASSRHQAWGEELWPRYLDQAVCDPSTSITDVWKLLRLCKPTQKTAEIAAKLAYETAHSDNMSNRATFRKVSECIAYLQESGEGLPPHALIAVYRVVTRDLAEGDWGRTSRLVWFLNLVRRECGAEKAEECRNMLRSWRQLVGRAKARGEEAAEESAVEEEN
ncbi:hypothetical protein CONLIGDRAFT_4032 [Coniochaeta ligniaria NRRL 30616]|uniref:Uncharacterized protein n=1 Tax=Coniochaeta ligniaria NRRL 30616 TaxID=1408157 RepID=A0A1J7J4M0_9PEZI|nr:hypothetical protein CONLIGDRAFT_4032 [Coniochaeta ligniaria NRRL 30616]